MMSMAQVMQTSPAGSLQERLAGLDAPDNAGFALHLAEALKIVELPDETIQPHFSGNHFQSARASPSSFPAREEWVLRWLLKSLATPENKSARCSFGAWHVLCHLLQTIPIRNAAKFLHEYNFLVILANTFDNAGELDNMTDSFKLLVDWILRTLASICDIIDGKNDNSSVGNFSKDATFIQAARQHMRTSLKTSPEDAAKIIGKGLNLIDSLFLHLSVTPLDESYTQSLMYNTTFLMRIWDYRSTANDNLSNQASNDAFASHALVSTIKLLFTCKSLLDQPQTDSVSRLLQSQLARHVLLPLREQFLETATSEIEQEAKIKELAALLPLETIKRDLQQLRESTNMQNVRLNVSGLLSPISELYEIAIMISPRDNVNRRIIEDEWLRLLFSTLLEISGISIAGTVSQSLSADQIYFLRDLLASSIDRKVALDSNLLANIATRLLSSEDNFPHSWPIIAQILELDIDVFLATKSTALLQILLNKISSVQTSDDPKSYGLVRSKVAIPLLYAFLQARIDFTASLQQQLLSHFEKSYNSPSAGSCSLPWSIWEDDEVLHHISQIYAKQSPRSLLLIFQNLAKEFSTFSEDHRVDKGKNRDTKSILSACAATIALEGILTALLELQQLSGEVTFWDEFNNIDINHVFKQLGDALESLLSHTDCRLSIYRWQFWTLKRLICEAFPLKTLERESLNRIAGSEALIEAIKTLKSILQKDPIGQAEFMEMYEIFRFAASAIYSQQSVLKEDLSEKASALVSYVINNFFDKQDKNRNGKTCLCSWDGQHQTMKSHSTLLAGLLGVVRKYPQLLICYLSESSQIRDFANAMLDLMQMDVGSNQTSVIINGPLLAEEFLSLKELQETPEIYGALITEILNASSEKQVVLNVIKQSTRTLSRQNIEMIVRKIELLLKQSLSTEELNQCLSWLVTCREYSNQLTERSLDSDTIQTLVKVLNRDDNISALPIFRKVIELALSSTFDSSRQHSTENQLVENIWKTTVKCVKKGSFIKKQGSLVLCDAVIPVLLRHQSHLPSLLTVKDLVNMRKLFIKSTLLDIALLRDSSTDYHDNKLLGVLVSVLCHHKDFLLAEQDGEFQKLVKSTLQLEQMINSGNHFSELGIQSLLLGLSSTSQLLQELDKSGQTHKRRAELLSVFRDLAVKADAETVNDVLSEFRKHLLEEHTMGLLEAMRVYIRSITLSKENIQNIKGQIMDLFALLTNKMEKEKTPELFELLISCMNDMLEGMSSALNQWNKDAALTAIVSATSESCPLVILAEGDAGRIYLRLCQLMRNIIILIRRKKIASRYHIVLPPLQGLLRCLFQGTHKKAASSVFSPAWIRAKGSTLNKPHAKAYDELLRIICDPTLSASGGRRKLNDETKRAKAIAGQHMPHVLMEYCKCQLIMPISGDIKDALAPGLYALFDCMNQDMLSAVNGAIVDQSQREVFKSLYEDYKSFGKWNRK